MFTVTATLGEAAAASVFTVLWRDGADCEALVSTSETVDLAAAGTGPASDESSATAVRLHRISRGVCCGESCFVALFGLSICMYHSPSGGECERAS